MSDKPNEPKDPKIIIDEDWKSQVQAEREAQRQNPQGEESAAAPSTDETPATPDAADQQAGPMPPASLSFLVTTLATQAMLALGLMPNPVSEKTEISLDQAKHFIDMIQVLNEKTEGNCTAEETEVLDHFLHQLRMGYVAVSKGQGQPPA